MAIHEAAEFADRLISEAQAMNAGDRWDILIYVRDTEQTPALAMDTATTRKSSMRTNFRDPEDLAAARIEIVTNLRHIASGT